MTAHVMTQVLTQVWVQRAIGCVVGSAVGDALGAPFEFGPAGQYSKRFPSPVLGGIGEMVGGGAFAWAPGQFTDDSEQAVVLGESLLACGGIDADDLLARLRAWAGGAADIGNLTSAVVHSDLPASQAAAEAARRAGPGRSASNGSLMRAAPGAVHFAALGREATVAAALELSAVTHADARCQWAVAMQHEMVRMLLLGQPVEAAVASALEVLPVDMAGVYVPLLAEGWVPNPGAPGNGSAMGALAQAVWSLRLGGSFAEVVTRVIDLGDDTDTVAAIAGALAGAQFGIQAIPSRWVTYLHGFVTGTDGVRHRYDHLALQRMASALAGWPSGRGSDDEPALAASEVLHGVWATNRSGAHDLPPEMALVSLCRIEDSLRRPIRREVYLVDQPGEANASLATAVDDAVDAIEAFLAEGRQVAVHCLGGRSRTGLVLLALMMRRGTPLNEAVALLEQRWPHAHRRNPAFADELQRRA
jgi:ADP-ribosyl-[dinitrogen reductase] hydrolase